MRTNILQYLEETAARVPEKVSFSDGKDSVTFAELYGGARSIGSFLAENSCQLELTVGKKKSLML